MNIQRKSFWLFVILLCTLSAIAMSQAKEVPIRHEEKMVLDEANLKISRAEFQAAIDLLLNFQENFPRSAALDRCYLYLAQCHFALGNYRKSQTQAEFLLTKYPKSLYVPDALQIAVDSYLEMDNYLFAAHKMLHLLESFPTQENTQKFFDITANLDDFKIQALENKYRNRDVNVLLQLEKVRRLAGKSQREASQQMEQLYRKASKRSPFYPTIEEYYQRYAQGMSSYAAPSYPMAAGGNADGVIAVVLPLSGSQEVLGQALQEGLLMAKADLRHQDIPQLVFLDSESSPIGAVHALREYQKEKPVIAVIGEISSENTLPLAAYCEAQAIPMIAPTATISDLHKIGYHVFRLNQPVEKQAEIMAKYAIRVLGFENFAVLASTSDFDAKLSQAFVNVVQEEGKNLLAAAYYEDTRHGLKKQMDRLELLLPEAVFMPSATEDDLLLVAPQIQYRKLPSQIFGSNSWGSYELIRRQGQYVENAIFTGSWSRNEQNPRYQSFQTEFFKKFGHDPAPVSVFAYDALHILAEGLQQCHKDYTSLRSKLSAITNFEGLTGKILRFDNQHFLKEIPIFTVKNGLIVPMNEDRVREVQERRLRIQEEIENIMLEKEAELMEAQKPAETTPADGETTDEPLQED